MEEAGFVTKDGNLRDLAGAGTALIGFAPGAPDARGASPASGSCSLARGPSSNIGRTRTS